MRWRPVGTGMRWMLAALTIVLLVVVLSVWCSIGWTSPSKHTIVVLGSASLRVVHLHGPFGDDEPGIETSSGWQAPTFDLRFECRSNAFITRINVPLWPLLPLIAGGA